MPNILVVEDDAMNRDMLARHLKWEGYQIVTAANGVEAIALAHSEAIDLILMAMGLPILDGWQATQRLKQAPAPQAIPIIALTAYALTEDRAKCLQAGCDDYETKPVDFPRLISKMRHWLATARPEKAHEEV